MTARCPKCGGKWDHEGLRDIHPEAHYWVSIPAGDWIIVRCYYCNTQIHYEIKREQLIKFFEKNMAELCDTVERLEGEGE